MKRPTPSAAFITKRLTEAGITPSPLVLLGRRGYFETQGASDTANDIGIYDDAIFICPPSAPVISFNANTDPSKNRPGMATLQPGRYKYRLGIHGISRPADAQYPAFVQAGPVQIKRGGSDAISAGWFGINIHRGGENTTSSEGCQTIYKPQWTEFIDTVKRLMAEHNVRTIDYILSEWKAAV